MSCFLVLGDGTVFSGKAFGAPAPKIGQFPSYEAFRAVGEVVFNTGMAGYHEILTDPSYAGQLVTMTYPHIGNYGADDSWSETCESDKGAIPGIKPAGLIVRSLYRGPVPEGRATLDSFLRKHDTPGITDVDTRALTLFIRDFGSPKGIIVRSDSKDGALSKAEIDECRAFLARVPEMVGRDLIGEVGTESEQRLNEQGKPHLVLVDCGIKANIVREMTALGCRLTVVPSGTTAERMLSLSPDAVLYSNGPGDPAVLDFAILQIRDLIGRIPVFGICLGHQLISLALGARTYKMKFGHHGVNHPVRDQKTGRVFVTSQNHGFAVDESTLPPDVEVWFRNANDETNEGIRHRGLPVLTAQFHPESAPGPRDSAWIFREFLTHIPA